jgi:hypothetical protein
VEADFVEAVKAIEQLGVLYFSFGIFLYLLAKKFFFGRGLMQNLALEYM